MFHKIQGGSTMTIGEGDLAVKVHLPPEGQVWNYEKGVPEPCEVIVRSMIKSEQYWERPTAPKDYAKLVSREKIIQRTDSSFRDPEVSKYKAREWHRRKFGVWFLNNGKMTYLTGLHYYYLTHWKIDVGYPDFRLADLRKAYFLQYCTEDPNSYGMVEITRRRAGKCFGKGTPIRMFDGTIKKVEDIRSGELVMGNDSTPRVVSGVTSGEEEMFEIIPNKGDSWTCNKSHILYGVESGKNTEVKLTVEEYLNLGESTRSNIKLTRTGFDLPASKHVVDPYFIGMWLGDGSSKSCEIYNEDPEVIDYIKNFCSNHKLNYYNYGASTQKVDHLRHSITGSISRACTYEGVRYKCKERLMEFLGKNVKTPIKTFGLYKQGHIKLEEAKFNFIWEEMKRLNLKNNKHIPDEYKVDSLENRLQLLAGMIDTDGTLVCKNGSYHFRISFSKDRIRLKDDFKNLIKSCGLSCNEIIDKSSRAFVLCVFGNVHIVPTKIKRKQAGVNVGRKNSLRTGFTVNPIGKGEYFGFAVDKNHLFLLADGTVVHNSFFAGCFITEFASRIPNAQAGIQSKTESDAKSFFGRAVVQPFRKLPDFFKPEYDKSQGDVPKKELRFYKSSKKGEQDSLDYDSSSELESAINYKNSKKQAYDGEKLLRYIGDEIFKVDTDIDILERHRIVRPCLEDSAGNVIGKALYTSTVEDMEGQMDDYIQFWADSDQSKKGNNGKTKSGLYRFFTPAQDMMHIDKYGIPDSKRGLQDLLKERLDLQDDPRALASLIRKKPTTWKEAFRTSGDDCLYNAMKIDERLDTLNWKKDYYESYDLIWEDVEKTKVKLVKSAKGKFKFSWTFPNASDANNVQIRGTNVIPKNILRFVLGIDPYDHNRTKNGRFSMGAGAVYMKFDPMDQDASDNFVCCYVARPQTAQLFYEDMIKLCHYFGCQMLFEDQKQGIKNYFHDRGYSAFIMRDAKGNEGISASQKSHQTIVEHTELFIEENCHRVNHPELLNDWKAFDMADTEKFDLGMASGYALIAASRIKKRETLVNKRSQTVLNKFQRTHKLRRNEKQLSKSLR